MPRVAESRIVEYCDFCSEMKQQARAEGSCGICGSLVCEIHSVALQFHFLRSTTEAKSDEEYFRPHEEVSRLLGFHALQRTALVCPECSARSTLAELVGKVKERSAES